MGWAYLSIWQARCYPKNTHLLHSEDLLLIIRILLLFPLLTSTLFFLLFCWSLTELPFALGRIPEVSSPTAFCACLVFGPPRLMGTSLRISQSNFWQCGETRSIDPFKQEPCCSWHQRRFLSSGSTLHLALVEWKGRGFWTCFCFNLRLLDVPSLHTLPASSAGPRKAHCHRMT